MNSYFFICTGSSESKEPAQQSNRDTKDTCETADDGQCDAATKTIRTCSDHSTTTRSAITEIMNSGIFRFFRFYAYLGGSVFVAFQREFYVKYPTPNTSQQQFEFNTRDGRNF